MGPILVRPAGLLTDPLLDVIIAEQAQYYGQRNQHVVDYYNHLLEEKRRERLATYATNVKSQILPEPGCAV